MSSRWILKRWVRTRSWWLNGTLNIRIRSYLVVVENDISYRIFVLIANTRRVKILQILRDLEVTLLSLKMLEILSKSKPWLTNLILMNCVSGGSVGMRGKSFVCKRYYIEILIEKLELHLLPGNPTYNLTDFSASEVKNIINRFSLPSEYKQPMKTLICHAFIGFQRCKTSL